MYSQITAASDWPRLVCTLGVFVKHITAFCHICNVLSSLVCKQFSLDGFVYLIIISY